MISEDRIRQIINEEISKTEDESIVSNRISSAYNTRDFKRAVKEVTAEVIEDLFRTLWNRSSTWKGGITR
jgi:predicted site-specific integrase-resolvase